MEGGEDSQAVPITVRQLEALVRISESLAKMRLSAEVAVGDVSEALRLFKVSTMSAASTGSSVLDMNNLRSEVRQEVVRAEDFLKQRISLGSTVNTKRMCEEATAQGHSDYAVRRAIAIMVKRNELVERNQGRLIRRQR
uniref:DNA helicase n=1 Tax=Fibrocapsa japonica TaxID=94617 RepID=A0A7S2V4P1_9STRA|mmetsp:Transcript_6933/g.10450  ORF Transcript_6933/g.10450 Transcript_6933/m.10450 type:complete len:139 (+) Transcript_6933:71-487(+)